jgi:RNA polymerase sigma-70 factor, ECF subfamily
MCGSTNDRSPAIAAGLLRFLADMDRFPPFRPCSGKGMGVAAKLSRPVTDRVRSTEDADSVDVRLKWAVAQHSRFVWRTLVRWGVREADAEDAAQEVFLVLARRLPEVSVSSERGFLFRTAVGVASTRRRSDKRRAELFDAPLDGVPVSTPGPELLVGRLRLRRLLQRALDELGTDQREVFILVELEGMTAPEVARLLQVPLGTVASRLGRGRRAFLEAIERLKLERELEDYEHG